ncbi:flavin reductase family protein [Amycolatopsis ultiminotia]|uniref:Flavin reductase family protein n=1 Tax=Amycolatopsis ultiminotia TaxID=543629 RepID=A0ABP6XWD0_9PSEU
MRTTDFDHRTAAEHPAAAAVPGLADRFRDVMAAVPSPVAVITAMADRVPHGTTVSAFASLSMTPPMVVICLDHGSELLAMVRTTGHFGVNVLGAGQSDLALTFSRKGGAAKFDGVGWTADHGLPRLGGSGWLACRTGELVEGGDHLLVPGRVLAADALKGDPLVYSGRVFGTHRALRNPV